MMPRPSPLILVLILVLTACSVGNSPVGPGNPTEVDVAALPQTSGAQSLATATTADNAAALSEAADRAGLANLAALQSAMAENQSPGLLDPAKGPAFALMTLSTNFEVLPDGTTVGTRCQRDDRGTAVKTDDQSVVTKTYTLPSGDTRVETIVRAVTPLANWNVWDSQGETTPTAGTLVVTVNGFQVARGTLTTTYRKVGTVISVAKVVRVEDRVDRYGVLLRSYGTVIYQTDNSRTESRYVYRYRSTGEAILIHSFVRTLVIDAQGISWTKLLRDDGFWWLTRGVGNVTYWKLYSPAGVLRQNRTETKVASTGDVVVHIDFMNAPGLVVARVSDFTLSYKYHDGQLQIQKTMADGQTYVTLIREAKEGGYDIVLSGVQYLARPTANGVVVTDKNGVSATITFGGDGTWTITYADGKKVNGRQ